jgi:hypothetical protein
LRALVPPLLVENGNNLSITNYFPPFSTGVGGAKQSQRNGEIRRSWFHSYPELSLIMGVGLQLQTNFAFLDVEGVHPSRMTQVRIDPPRHAKQEV